VVTPTHCPAVAVPTVTPCDPTELQPLIDYLRHGESPADALSFTRGTVLPGGRLDLCKQSIGPDGAARVLDALDGSGIRTILFGTGAIGNTGAKAVADALDRGVELETVYLGCNKITDVGPLAEAVERSNVDALWLKRNPLGEAGGKRLAEVIARGGPRVLDVYNCELGDAGVAAIARALASPACRVEHVYLGGNAAGSAAAEALGELLATTTRLRSLQLSASRFTDCIAPIARGLAHNRSLEELGLATCGITPGGGTAIADALVRHPHLLRIDFAIAPSSRALAEPANRIGDAGAPALANLIRANGPLRSLDLRENSITSKGAFPILEALYANHHVVELSLHHRVARTIRRSIRARLDANAARAPKFVMPAHVAAIQSVYRSR
jgi:hypothetical protein